MITGTLLLILGIVGTAAGNVLGGAAAGGVLSMIGVSAGTASKLEMGLKAIKLVRAVRPIFEKIIDREPLSEEDHAAVQQHYAEHRQNLFGPMDL